MRTIAEGDTAVAKPETIPTPQTPPATKPDEKESAKDIERRARKPPKDGPCKGCGKNLPLNRLMLCFRCWVNKNLNDWAKAQGRDFIPNIDPHPSWCHCGLPEHSGKNA